jgi:septation ring formation regulator EzrA
MPYAMNNIKNIKMKNLQSILKEISEITTDIETNYPELYRSLDENPMTLATTNHPHVDKIAMKEYLESLKELLKHHSEVKSA